MLALLLCSEILPLPFLLPLFVCLHGAESLPACCVAFIAGLCAVLVIGAGAIAWWGDHEWHALRAMALTLFVVECAGLIALCFAS